MCNANCVFTIVTIVAEVREKIKRFVKNDLRATNHMKMHSKLGFLEEALTETNQSVTIPGNPHVVLAAVNINL